MSKISQVCLIDDDYIFVYGAKRLMREMDFYDDLAVFSNGQEALDHFTGLVENDDVLPALVFLDLNMPIMNGWEFLEALGNVPGAKLNEVTIYIMSSSVDPRDLEKIQTNPFIKNYVLKPLTTEDLEKIAGDFT